MADSHQSASVGLSSHTENISHSTIITGDQNTVINYTVHAPPVKSPPPSNIWFNVFDPIDSYFERKNDFLPNLHKSLHAKDDDVGVTVLSRIKIISGLGGIGKTQMARKYIQKYKAEYDHVVWVGAESRNSMATSFLKLAEILKVPKQTEDKKDREIDQIVKDCYDIICLKKCLMVFDNAEHYDDRKFKNENGIRAFLPSSLPPNLEPPFILVTSRIGDWASLTRHVMPMELFSDVECIEFIRSRLPSETHCEEDASKLGRILGGLVLALQQAVTYIREQEEDRRGTTCAKFGVKEYIAVFEEKGRLQTVSRTHLLNFPPSESDHDYNATVATTWTITLEKVQESEDGGGLLVKEICEVMSFLRSEMIPMKLILNIFEHEDQIQIGKCMRLLRRYGLIEMSAGSNFVSMHRLVQHVILESIKKADRMEVILEGLVQSCDDLVQNLGYNFEVGSDLLKNFLSIIEKFEVVPAKPEFCSFEFEVGWRYMAMGRGMESMAIFQHVLDVQHKLLGSEHPHTLETQFVVAQLLANQGKFKEAVEMYEYLITCWQKCGNPDDPNLMKTQSGMAAALHEQRENERAMAIYENIFEILKKTKDPEYPMLLAVQNNMALILTVQGRYQKAFEMYEHILTIGRNSLSSKDPSLLTTMNDMASVLVELGQYEKALKMYTEVFEAQKNILGTNHPKVLIVQNNIAFVLERQGKWEEAMKIYRRVLTARKDVHGDEHRAVLSTQFCMARTLQKQGQGKEALTMFENLLPIQKRVLCPRHPQVVDIQVQIADIHTNDGKYIKAMEMYEHILETYKQKLGPDHPKSLEVQVSIANIHQEQGRLEKALEIFEHTLHLAENDLTSNHPLVLRIQHNKAVALEKQGKYVEAMKLLQRVHEIRQQNHDSHHPDSLSTLGAIAHVLAGQKMYGEAIEIFEQVLGIQTQILNPKHPQLLKTLTSFAFALYGHGRQKEAIEVLENVVAVQKKIQSPDDPRLLNAQATLCNWLSKQQVAE